MKTKSGILWLLFLSIFISEVNASTYTFAPDDLIFRTNVFTYDNQFIGQNGVNFKITGGSLVLDTTTNISSLNFDFILMNRIGKDATTFVPVGSQGRITGQTNNSGLILDPNNLSSIFGRSNFDMVLDFNANTIEDWNLRGDEGIYCTAKNCNSLSFPNNPSEPMGFALQGLGSNKYAFQTDNFFATNSGLVLDNTWFEGSVRLSNSAGVPEPVTGLLLGAGLVQGFLRRKKSCPKR